MKDKKLPLGPDVVHNGDGLPDWMQFTIKAGMFGLLIWILYLLFHPTLSLEENLLFARSYSSGSISTENILSKQPNELT